MANSTASTPTATTMYAATSTIANPTMQQLPPRPTTYASALIGGQSTSAAPALVLPPPKLIQQIPKKPNPTRFAAAPAAIASTSNPIENSSQSQTTAASSTSTPSSTSSKSGSSSNNWPPALKTFVERSFARCTVDEDRAFIENELKKLIAKIASDGRLNVHRWDLEPTPVPPSKVVVAPPQVTEPKMTATSTMNVETGIKKRQSRFSELADDEKNTTSLSKYGPPVVEAASNKKQKKSSIVLSDSITDKDLEARNKRANRFLSSSDVSNDFSVESKTGSTQQPKKKVKNKVITQLSNSSSATMTEFDLESLIVVGTCMRPDKEYLRLTSAPDPSTVRPEHILKKAFENVTNKWENDKDSSEKYISICSQFKSIRQDLTVQHILNGIIYILLFVYIYCM